MNIEKMSLADLTALNAKVNEQMPKTMAREKQAARGEIDKLLAAKGLKLVDVLGASGSARRSTKGQTVPPKYRDPKSGATWAGRGRRPAWYDPKHPERFQVAESA